MRLFPRTQFLDRSHFLLHIRPLPAGRHRAHASWLLLDFVNEGRVIRSPQDEQPLLARVRSINSYIPSSGIGTSFSAARYSVGTLRPQSKVSVAFRMPGLGFEFPPGASATTALIR